MKYRNALVALLIFGALLPLCGCGAHRGRLAVPEPTPTPVPTPTPAPTPIPAVALWGAEDAPAFARAMESAVRKVGYTFVTLGGGEDALTNFTAEGRACIVVCCTGEAPAARPAGNVFYCMLGGAALPAGAYGVRYDSSEAVQKTFSEILAYPPHCAPVRLLGLFTSEDGAAYAAYDAACGNGAFFSRGAYFADGGKTPGDWLAGRLDGIYPGMLDGIFAETSELAQAAAETLANLSRDDAEIFAASTSGDVLLSMQNRPGLVACAVGCRPEDAAETCVNNAILMMIGETVHSGALLPETFLYSGAGAP